MNFSRYAWSILSLVLMHNTFYAAPLTPLRRFHSLVAGVPEIGTNDGSFIDARFDTPSGILFDKSRYCLFVADASSGQIRQIDLKHANAVSTFYPGKQELLSPTAMEWMPEPDALWVLDKGRNNIAKIKLADKSLDWFFPASPTANAARWAIGSMAPAGNTTTGAIILTSKTGTPLAAYSLLSPNAAPVWMTLSDTAKPMTVMDIRTTYNGIYAIVEIEGRRQVEHWSLPGAGPFPWDSFSALSSAARAPLLRTTVDSGAALTPTAFLRQTDQFTRVINQQNPLGAVLLGQGGVAPQWPIDESGRALSTESHLIFNYTAQPIGEDTLQKGKPFFHNLAAGCFDKQSKTWYMSDPKNHRIVSYHELDLLNLRNVPNGTGGIAYPARHPNSRRVWLHGTSIAYYSGDGPGRLFDGFPIRLEKYLNLFSCLKGSDLNYEVQFKGGNALYQANLPCRTAALIDIIRGRFSNELPDTILVCITPEEFYAAAADFGERTLDAEGLPLTPFDPESLEDPGRINTLSSQYQDIVKYMNENPKKFSALRIDKAGLLQARNGAAADIFGKDLADEKTFSLFSVFLKKYLDKIDKTLIEESLKAGVPKPRVILVELPIQSLMEKEERNNEVPGDSKTIFIDQACENFSASLGWELINVIKPLRAIAPDFPFMFMNNSHPSKNGHDFIGLITAIRMLETATEK